MNRLLSVIAGLLVVGAVNADNVSLSDFSWDGKDLQTSLNSLGINLATDYTMVNVETWLTKQADCMIVEELSGLDPINTFGYYDVNNPATLHEIFPGPASKGATEAVVLDQAKTIGFYLTPGSYFELPKEVGEVFYTQNSKNPGGLGQAVIYENKKDPGDFILGWEDLSMTRPISTIKDAYHYTDGDFNDFVVRVKVSVPEPLSISFLGISLLSLCGISFFRKRR